MKNIHVLSTGIFIAGIETKNIYITSNEEIKEDYVIAYGVVIKVMIFDKETLYFVNGTKAKRKDCKKIILTTDQDLIEDGVQAIDDEFLEWFVKNPSCEEVEIISTCGYNNNWFGKVYFSDYKIIIPKEEAMSMKEEFEKSVNIIDDWLKKNGDPEIHKQVEQEAKELCEQETLEEFSKQEAIKQYSEDTFGNLIVRKSIEKGAKWQAERMYSEEEVSELVDMLQKCKEYFLLKTDLKSEERADAIGQVLEQFKNK